MFIEERHIILIPFSVGWLVVFYVSSTVRSFRDSTPFIVPCEGCDAPILHCSHREWNPGSSLASPLHHRCTTPAQSNLIDNDIVFATAKFPNKL